MNLYRNDFQINCLVYKNVVFNECSAVQFTFTSDSRVWGGNSHEF